jgi:uncharacterized DUF497 family protein
MGFEWDDNKNAINEAKHGISFEEATDVFDDPDHIVEESTQPEHGEARFLAIGQVGAYLTTVIFTYRQGNQRIISARRAKRSERGKYRQGPPSA